MYNAGKTTPELWAVTNSDGHVLWTRGGSSTSSRLMVYESEAKARRSLKNPWIKQVHDVNDVLITRIYNAQEGRK